MQYKDKETKKVGEGQGSRKLPQQIQQRAHDKLTALDAASCPEDMKMPPGNRLEKLKGDREGQWSVRINDQYRICFGWDGEAIDVEITDYH